MKIILKNNCQIINPPLGLAEQIKEDLLIENPEYKEAKKYGRWLKGIKEYLKVFNEEENKIVVPRGYLHHFGEYKDEIESLEDETVNIQPIEIKSKITLRDYQKPWIESLMSQRYGVGVAPPGSGKTCAGIEVIARLGGPALWITHTSVLLNQFKDRALEFLKINEGDVGVIGGGKEKFGKIDVALVQTLIRRDLQKLDKYNIIIVDESHRVPSYTFMEVVNSFSPKYMYGLTATPYREDGLEDLMYYSIGPELARLEKSDIKKKVPTFYIPRYTNFTYEFPTDPKTGHDKITPKHYSKMIKKLVRDISRNKMISEDVISEALYGNICVVLSGRINHLKKLKELIGKDVPCTIITHNTKESDRKTILEDLHECKYLVLLATYRLLAEGFDFPLMSRLFITYPVKAKALVTQACGRIERIHKDKKYSLIYDYVDTNIGLLNFHHKLRTGFYSEGNIERVK